MALRLVKSLSNRKVVQTCTAALCRKFSQKKDESGTEDVNLGQIASKYKVFKDEDAEVILDVYEERLKYTNLLEEEKEPHPDDAFEGLNLERGINGVFDIEDLVEALKRENAVDVFVASVPPELNYVDYICIVSSKSHRHMQAISEFIRRLYKRKRHEKDDIPKLEGAGSAEWKALDLGNIALHVFSREARARYDLDSLWSVGPEFDAESNKKDAVVEMLERHSVYLKDLVPAS